MAADSRGAAKRRTSRYTRPVIAETTVSLTPARAMRPSVEPTLVWTPMSHRTAKPTMPETTAAPR